MKIVITFEKNLNIVNSCCVLIENIVAERRVVFWIYFFFFLMFLFCSQRFSIKERVYPAIIPVEDKKVDGKV